MTTKEQKLWHLGREVVFALPIHTSALHPGRSALSAAAKKVGVSKRRAGRALEFYIWN